MLLVVCDVATPVPDIEPFNGVDCEAKAAGKMPNRTNTASNAGIRVVFFIL